MQPIEISVLGVDVAAQLQPFSYAGAVEPAGKIQVAAFSPRSLMHLFDVEAPETADPVVLSRVIMDVDAKVSESAIELSNVNIKLDDTTFTGSLVADTIDLNRYMEPASEAATSSTSDSAPTELPADLIKPLNARGGLKIASVVLGDLKLEQVTLGLDTANGRMTFTAAATVAMCVSMSQGQSLFLRWTKKYRASISHRWHLPCSSRRISPGR
jgi:AsmA protein